MFSASSPLWNMTTFSLKTSRLDSGGCPCYACGMYHGTPIDLKESTRLSLMAATIYAAGNVSVDSAVALALDVDKAVDRHYAYQRRLAKEYFDSPEGKAARYEKIRNLTRGDRDD